MYDVSLLFNNKCNGTAFKDENGTECKIKQQLYADEALLTAESGGRRQVFMDEFCSFYDTMSLKINVKKNKKERWVRWN